MDEKKIQEAKIKMSAKSVKLAGARSESAAMQHVLKPQATLVPIHTVHVADAAPA